MGDVKDEEKQEIEEMVDFILAKLDEEISAKDLLEEVRNIFEDDAEDFVLKLYRTLIYETLKAKAMPSN